MISLFEDTVPATWKPHLKEVSAEQERWGNMLPIMKDEDGKLRTSLGEHDAWDFLGTNSNAVTLSRWYKGSPLHLDGILTGGVRTYSAESAITDSAAAGTAMATGVKTKADYIGMDPEGRPLITVLEAAKLNGYATGIVATSPVQHATPAAFTRSECYGGGKDDWRSLGENERMQKCMG